MIDKPKLPAGVRLGVSPLSWSNDVLEDLGADISVETCLSDAADVGYSGVELGRKFPRDAAVLGPMLREHRLQLASGWYSGLLADRDADVEMAAVARHASLLRELGVSVMVYGECGQMFADAPLDAPMSRRLKLKPDALSNYIDRLSDFAARLRANYGLALAYHHHLMMVAETFDEVSAIFERAGRDVGLLLDTGHARAAGFDYAQLIERFGDRIVHIHLKDVRGEILAQVRRDDMSFNEGVRHGMFTVPGDGDIDFQPVARFVRESGYRGWLIVEAEQDPAFAPPKPTVAKALFRISSLFGD